MSINLCPNLFAPDGNERYEYSFPSGKIKAINAKELLIYGIDKCIEK